MKKLILLVLTGFCFSLSSQVLAADNEGPSIGQTHVITWSVVSSSFSGDEVEVTEPQALFMQFQNDGQFLNLSRFVLGRLSTLAPHLAGKELSDKVLLFAIKTSSLSMEQDGMINGRTGEYVLESQEKVLELKAKQQAYLNTLNGTALPVFVNLIKLKAVYDPPGKVPRCGEFLSAHVLVTLKDTPLGQVYIGRVSGPFKDMPPEHCNLSSGH